MVRVASSHRESEKEGVLGNQASGDADSRKSRGKVQRQRGHKKRAEAAATPRPDRVLPRLLYSSTQFPGGGQRSAPSVSSWAARRASNRLTTSAFAPAPTASSAAIGARASAARVSIPSRTSRVAPKPTNSSGTLPKAASHLARVYGTSSVPARARNPARAARSERAPSAIPEMISASAQRSRTASKTCPPGELSTLARASSPSQPSSTEENCASSPPSANEPLARAPALAAARAKLRRLTWSGVTGVSSSLRVMRRLSRLLRWRETTPSREPAVAANTASTARSRSSGVSTSAQGAPARSQATISPPEASHPRFNAFQESAP